MGLDEAARKIGERVSARCAPSVRCAPTASRQAFARSARNQPPAALTKSPCVWRCAVIGLAGCLHGSLVAGVAWARARRDPQAGAASMQACHLGGRPPSRPLALRRCPRAAICIGIDRCAHQHVTWWLARELASRRLRPWRAFSHRRSADHGCNGGLRARFRQRRETISH